MMRISPLILMVASLSALAAPADFSRGRVVQSTDTITQRVILPQDVYEWVVRADLGDLRVFNAGPQETPYAIRRPASTQDHTPWTDLPVFTLPAASTAGTSGTDVNIELGDTGTVVAVHGATSADMPGAGFLVDASSSAINIAELELGWSQPGNGFVGKFHIESSDDLHAWRSVVDSATLATLETQGRQIVLDRIKLPGARARYLRISQLDGRAQLNISSVRARATTSQLPERHWKSLNGTPNEDGYEYDTGGHFPLDRINLELPQETYLVAARLFSKPREEGQWRDRGQRTFYRVAVNGTEVTSDPIAYSVRDRYWRAEILSEGDELPTLRIGWLPDELIFLKQGDAPYVLAYGQAGVAGRQWPMSDLLGRMGSKVEIHDIPIAGLGAANTLGGPGRLKPAPAPVDWETVLLWAVLVIGVAFIGLLAFRLLRAR